MTNSMKISFPGSITQAGKQRTASWELRHSFGKVQMGFAKSDSAKTKTKWFDLEEVEVIMGSLLENQTELASMIDLAKQGLELGMVIVDGELVDPKPEPKKEEPVKEKAEEPKAKTFSLSGGSTPPPTKKVSTVAKAPSKSRSEKIAELRSKMGR